MNEKSRMNWYVFTRIVMKWQGISVTMIRYWQKFFSYPSCCTFEMILTIIMMMFSHGIFRMNHFSGIVSVNVVVTQDLSCDYFVFKLLCNVISCPCERWMTLAHNRVINIFRCLIRLLPFHDFHDNLFKFTFTHSKLKLFELDRRRRWRQDHFPLYVLTFPVLEASRGILIDVHI